ncbi:MAG: CoA transferase [Gammaproteobacteria bacterium]|nr:CoA transferase [Gammaproteobacteria bacterium]MDH4253877.1 CoA transferase [Gammaproteobacteria bacterium]
MPEAVNKQAGGALDGVRVVDLSRILAGPWAAQLLADYGADVIKIERPVTGDDTRQWGPPWIQGDTGDSAYFCAANRNKRSITCDLAHPLGQQLIRDLVATADVVIENFRAGALARYGLDAATLRGLYPSLIYCTLSAYGQHGPRAGEAGYDAMMQASGGLMSITGEPAEAGGRPQKVGVAIADIMAGMYAATAILAALNARHATGEGQSIDVPLFDSQLAWLANQGLNYLIGGIVPGRLGTAHPNIVPYQAFETSDGDLMLAVGNDRQFAACADIVDCPELALDARFATNAARVSHRRELVELLAERFRTRPTESWLTEFRARGVPVGPINDLAAAFADPHVSANNLVKRLPHPLAGELPTVANPVRFSATAVTYRRSPPLLGEHTQEVLAAELGYRPARIEELRAAGVI